MKDLGWETVRIVRHSRGRYSGCIKCLFSKDIFGFKHTSLTNPLEEILDIDWEDLKNMKKNERDNFETLAPSAQMAPEDLISTVDRRLDYISSQESGNLRQEEYLNFIEAPIDPDLAKHDNNFRLRKQMYQTAYKCFLKLWLG